jgi:conjugative relaxase-like TrwC/TraI family protein
MIRMIPSLSPGHAKAYFGAALAQPDYYLDDQELQGQFLGRLAVRLGIEGPATKEAFYALCENRHPGTGAPLTPRLRSDRVTGYDINFHCPKSVSILHALAQDNHILEAFQRSVHETMRDIEADAKTRVRRNGRSEDRETGELAWGEFIHQTARPVDGYLPDPHLHSHCFVFNATWDAEEARYKAAKFRDIKRDMPYYQARFHKRLSDRMIRLGYRVKRTKNSFEINGVPERVIALFSKRTDEIGRVATEKGIEDAKALDALGAMTRGKKQKGLSMAELKAAWREQIREVEQDGESGRQPVRFAPRQAKAKTDARRCVDHAVTHCFERASVMPERRILEAATRDALGDETITLEEVGDAFRQDGRIIEVKQGGQALCTTKAVLQEEKRMVELARQGRNRMVPLYKEVPALDLNEQQAEAVRHVLTTTDRVSIIRGAAGTGKTKLMRAAVDLIEQAGKKVFVAAPTAEASRGVLKEEGFVAQTVASLLVDQSQHQSLQDQVLWVDEAGLLGTKDMGDILELATQRNARVIFGGDTKQHASVVRGDALRILNTVGGIRSAEVSRIMRQKDAAYRAAVEDLSKGRVAAAFDRLDDMGAIRAVDPMKPHEALVEDYVGAVKKGKSALVISPTHKEGEAVTSAIRLRLRQMGRLGRKEIAALKLSSLNLTEAEKGDWRHYKPDQVVQFNQNARGFRRGSAWIVREARDGKVRLVNEAGATASLPLKEARKFEVFERAEIALSKGDRVRITRNGFDARKKRLNNGQTLEVVSVSKTGRIALRGVGGKGEYELDQGFGHIAHAHCITSYAAQGKTVDEVLIAQPAATFAATDARQFYVSVSRGREAVKIYTDDKEALLTHALEIGNRQSALELVGGKRAHGDYVEQRQRSDYDRPTRENANQEKETAQSSPTINRDYEPEF